MWLLLEIGAQQKSHAGIFFLLVALPSSQQHVFQNFTVGFRINFLNTKVYTAAKLKVGHFGLGYTITLHPCQQEKHQTFFRTEKSIACCV